MMDWRMKLNEVKVLQKIFDIHIDIQCLLYILLIIHICTPTEIDATLICNFPFATTVWISYEILSFSSLCTFHTVAEDNPHSTFHLANTCLTCHTLNTFNYAPNITRYQIQSRV